ncbi:hypothetical protein PVA44_06235 [Entomospira nematocerorum]|uniref:Uncharacterized protein n=1 Tax=Entomospira nematocerorum TaxID=2719987 RepID=A0A968KSE7_9SPIO|nr:hypothetical protein [Entomospira nematocera]NIZ46381.1 hypothetical protein [Entomospira nematocera]WDI33815.1 hypothetical protein PVA44_06235 [Entomospira nematocera]
MWQKKPTIPKSSTVQDRYKHGYVLPRLQDERAQQKLNISAGVIIAIFLGLFGWGLLYKVFHIFERGFFLFLLGVIFTLVFLVIGWFLGIRIAHQASQMRIDRYYDLYETYMKHIDNVEQARNALMRAEEDLAQTEKSLDNLIAQTHNRPAVLAGMAAITAVIMKAIPFSKTRNVQKNHKKMSGSTPFSSVDLTDEAVYQHERQHGQEEE